MNVVSQIETMASEGHSAEDIANALGWGIDSVEIVIAAMHKRGGMIKKSIISHVATEAQLAGEQLPSEVKQKNARQIMEENHARIAQKLVALALDPSGENSSAAVKAAIYINEEITGRNDARAKRESSSILIDIGRAMEELKKVDDVVSRALGKGQVQNLAAIDV